MIELGKIKEVSLRDIWKHEQYNFSSWLAKEENLNELGSVLHLNLIEPETEKYVGSYRCDIICKDDISGKNVLIEDQLEPSDHDHLGKIITYASGLDASVIVWIVEEAKEEHASAIEWLNKHIDAEISFFLIEIHAIQIGNSLPASMFKIIEQPNDFNQQVKEINQKGEMNESMARRLEFWSMFNDVIKEHGTPFNIRKATTDHWYDVAIGSSICHLAIDLVNKEGYIRINMWIPDSKEQYDKFYENKESIENSIGTSLFWQRMDDKKASRVSLKIDGLDFENQDNYHELMDKIIEMILKFKKAFKTYLI